MLSQENGLEHFRYALQAFIEYTTAPDIGFYEVHKSHLPKSWFLLYQFPIKVSMKTDLIRKIYTKYINKLNKNIQSKGLTGKMYLCRFENHDGNILLKVYLKHLYS